MDFTFGKISISLAAIAALKDSDTHLWDLLERHERGDSGICPSSDARKAISSGEEVFSGYELTSGLVVCVSTEPARSATSIFISTEDENAV